MVGNRAKKKQKKRMMGRERGGWRVGSGCAKLTITGPLMIQAAAAVCDYSDLVRVGVAVRVHIGDAAICQVIRRDVSGSADVTRPASVIERDANPAPFQSPGAEDEGAGTARDSDGETREHMQFWSRA